jgi:hypothetical protein
LHVALREKIPAKLRRRYPMKRRSLISAMLVLMLALAAFSAQAVQPAELPQREQSMMLEGQLTSYLASQFVKQGQFALWFDAADFDALPTDTGVKLTLRLNLLPSEVSLEVAQAAQPGAAGDQLLAVAQTALKEDNWEITPVDTQLFAAYLKPVAGIHATKEGSAMDVYQIEMTTGTFHLTLRYPLEAAEGWGARMNSFALNFEGPPAQ